QKIEISNEELIQAAVLHVSELSRHYGYKISEQQLHLHAKELIEDKRNLQGLYQNTLSAKVYKHVRDIVKPIDKEVTFAEFEEINKKQSIPDLAYKIAKEAGMRGYLTK